MSDFSKEVAIFWGSAPLKRLDRTRECRLELEVIESSHQVFRILLAFIISLSPLVNCVRVAIACSWHAIALVDNVFCRFMLML